MEFKEFLEHYISQFPNKTCHVFFNHKPASKPLWPRQPSLRATVPKGTAKVTAKAEQGQGAWFRAMLLTDLEDMLRQNKI